MKTLGEAARDIEEQHFVGRQYELRTFATWLDQRRQLPAILNVTGPGGVGKTALLGAFRRVAENRNLSVIAVDAQDVPPTELGMLQAVDGNTVAEALAHLNAMSPVLLVDTFEEFSAPMRAALDKLLPGLDPGVCLVIAGRDPLGLHWPTGSPWHTFVHAMPLHRFAPAESRAYVAVRGVDDGPMAEQILAVGRDDPLALALAVDLAKQLGVRSLAAAPEWHLAVRTLVETLLRDVPDAMIRDLLEACAVVRHFDQAMLEALLGHSGIGPAFDRLCRLSAVRPTHHGLMLHDEVRRLLAQDLRWRRPQRYTELRLRALAYCRERMQTASTEERRWLVTERLSLCEDAVIQASAFSAELPEPIWVDPYHQEDRQDVVRIWSAVVEQTGGQAHSSFAKELPFDFLERLLTYPAINLAIAHTTDGRALGFGLILPLCGTSLRLLPKKGPLLRLVHAFFTPGELAALPDAPETSRVMCMFRLATIDGNAASAAGQALVRGAALGVVALGGTILVATAEPLYKHFITHLGFVRIPEAECEGTDPAQPFDGFVLDLARIGVEPWIESIMTGQAPPSVLRGSVLEEALHEVFLHWNDDSYLATSPLVHCAAVVKASPGCRGAEAVRHATLSALAHAREHPCVEDALAYSAVEAAYLRKDRKQDRIAEDLSVSRTTFYRLLKRGVHGVAQALDDAASEPWGT